MGVTEELVVARAEEVGWEIDLVVSEIVEGDVGAVEGDGLDCVALVVDEEVAVGVGEGEVGLDDRLVGGAFGDVHVDGVGDRAVEGEGLGSEEGLVLGEREGLPGLGGQELGEYGS